MEGRRIGVRFPAGAKIVFFSAVSRPAPVSIQPEALSKWSQRPGREFYHSSLSVVEVKIHGVILHSPIPL